MKVPVLANITEFGSTPLFTVEELRGAGVAIVLYPLSAFRAMNKAAQAVYEACAEMAHRSMWSTSCRHAKSSTTPLATGITSINSTPCSIRKDKLLMSNVAEMPNAPKAKKSVALSGVTAGNTALCTVGRTGNDLAYRGYDILDLAAACEFEEVAYLLVHGQLPNAAELAGYKKKLQALRGIPASVMSALEALPASSHPMDVMRTAVSAWAAHCPRRTTTTHRARATSPTASWPASAACCSTGITTATTAA